MLFTDCFLHVRHWVKHWQGIIPCSRTKILGGRCYCLLTHGGIQPSWDVSNMFKETQPVYLYSKLMLCIISVQLYYFPLNLVYSELTKGKMWKLTG